MDENAERISLELIAGDEQAFDTVYKQYYRGLCAFASQYVTVPESEEIVQDVMMWLWENRKSLVADMSLKSLLFTIVRNKCLNTISHIQVKQQVHERLYAKFQEQFENPDFYIGELMALASKAIRELPDEYRKAFEMNRFEEMTYNEIAERTGVSPKTIAYRISSSAEDITDGIKGLYPFIGMAALRTNTLITEEASYRHERFFNESKDLFHERCFQ